MLNVRNRQEVALGFGDTADFPGVPGLVGKRVLVTRSIRAPRALLIKHVIVPPHVSLVGCSYYCTQVLDTHLTLSRQYTVQYVRLWSEQLSRLYTALNGSDKALMKDETIDQTLVAL